MPGDEPLTIETMRLLAHQAGLALSDAELTDVMAGVGRNRERAKTLEKWVTQAVEPATGSLVDGFRGREWPLTRGSSAFTRLALSYEQSKRLTSQELTRLDMPRPHLQD